MLLIVHQLVLMSFLVICASLFIYMNSIYNTSVIIALIIGMIVTNAINEICICPNLYCD